MTHEYLRLAYKVDCAYGCGFTSDWKPGISSHEDVHKRRGEKPVTKLPPEKRPQAGSDESGLYRVLWRPRDAVHTVKAYFVATIYAANQEEAVEFLQGCWPQDVEVHGPAVKCNPADRPPRPEARST